MLKSVTVISLLKKWHSDPKLDELFDFGKHCNGKLGQAGVFDFEKWLNGPGQLGWEVQVDAKCLPGCLLFGWLHQFRQSATNLTEHFRKSACAKDCAKGNGKREQDEK